MPLPEEGVRQGAPRLVGVVVIVLTASDVCCSAASRSTVLSTKVGHTGRIARLWQPGQAPTGTCADRGLGG